MPNLTEKEIYDLNNMNVAAQNPQLGTLLQDLINGGGGGGGSSAIEEIQRNGVPLPIEDKTVNVVVPTKISELQNDGEFLTKSGGNVDDYFMLHSDNHLSLKSGNGDYGNMGNTTLSFNGSSGGVATSNFEFRFPSGNYIELREGYPEEIVRIHAYGPVYADGFPDPVEDSGLATKQYVDNADNFFIATYGVTTIQELRAAFNANKKIMCFVPELSGGSAYGVLLLCDNHEPSDGYFNFVGLVGPSSIATTSIQDDMPWSTPHVSRVAPLNTPNFTGVPKAPTAAEGTANTQIATTAFVQNAINSVNPTIQTDGDWAYKVYNDNTFEAWYAIDSEMIDVQTQDTGESVWKSAPQTLTLPSKLTNVYDMVIMFVDVSVGNPNVSTWASLSGTSQSQIEYRVVAAKNISANCFIACHVFGVLFPKS